jgi:hypothetical protein
MLVGGRRFLGGCNPPIPSLFHGASDLSHRMRLPTSGRRGHDGTAAQGSGSLQWQEVG